MQRQFLTQHVDFASTKSTYQYLLSLIQSYITTKHKIKRNEQHKTKKHQNRNKIIIKKKLKHAQNFKYKKIKKLDHCT